MQAAVDKAKAAIVAGTLTVPDWTATRSCPP
jgi:basic membrane protein A